MSDKKILSVTATEELVAELSTLRASLAEREAELATTIEQCKKHEADITDSWIAKVAERDRQLVVMREALESISECDPPSEYVCGTEAPQYCKLGCSGCIARAALSSTSSAAERVERGIGAKYLREAADAVNGYRGDSFDLREIVYNLQGRAEALENKNE